MRIEGDTLILPEFTPYFLKAASGRRTNSIFSTNRPGHAQFMDRHEQLSKVRIYDTKTAKEFERKITDLTHWGALADAYYWVVTWQHDDSPVKQGGRDR